MKKNAIRLAKLEDKLVVDRSDIFMLSDLEILERIQELEFQKRRKPTKKCLDMINTADRTKPIFTPKVYQRMKEEQAERSAEIAAMNDQEIDDCINKLIIESGMEGTFEDMSDQEIEDFNKSERE